MSVQVEVWQVNWDTFLSTFPEPGDWADPLEEPALDVDDFAANMQAGELYEAMRASLDPGTIRALDKLVVAVCINGFKKPKALDHTSLYKPDREYDPDDFEIGSGIVVPRASPTQVAEILEAADSAPADAIAADLERAWPKTRKNRFRTPKSLHLYFRNWLEILREIRQQGGGLSIDLG